MCVCLVNHSFYSPDLLHSVRRYHLVVIWLQGSVFPLSGRQGLRNTLNATSADCCDRVFGVVPVSRLTVCLEPGIVEGSSWTLRSWVLNSSLKGSSTLGELLCFGVLWLVFSTVWFVLEWDEEAVMGLLYHTCVVVVVIFLPFELFSQATFCQTGMPCKLSCRYVTLLRICWPSDTFQDLSFFQECVRCGSPSGLNEPHKQAENKSFQMERKLSTAFFFK